MDISSGFGDLHEIREAIRAIKPFESEIRAISDGGVVYEIHAKRALEYSDCAECLGKSLPGGESFSIELEPSRELLAWDVAYAIARVGDGRSSFAVPDEMVRSLLQLNAIHVSKHLDHVDPSIPGIVTVVPMEIAGSQYLPLLIDGSHRAARCLRDGLPFRVRWLTAQESFLSMESAGQKLRATAQLMWRHGL